MCRHLFLAILVVACFPTATCVRPKPLFSWSTVPIFQHLASVNATFSQPFPAPRLQWLASSYPLVVLEHAQGQGHWAYTLPNGTGSQWGPAPFSPPSGLIEDHFIAAADALKAMNSSLIVLYYQQITGALPYYRASQAANAHPEWTLDANCAPRTTTSGGVHQTPQVGDILPNYATWAWDHTQNGVTQNFVANFLNVSSHSSLDGTFIDTASCYNSGSQAAASLATVQAMQLAAPNKIVGFHTESSLSGANGFSAAMDYTFAQPSVKGPQGKGAKDTTCQGGLDWLSANGEAGVLSLAHIGDVDQGPDYTYSLACYLAGANELS